MVNPGSAGQEALIGATVMGERGQIVIPKEFRDQLDLQPGARLVVVRHPGGPIILLPAAHAQEMIATFSDRVTSALKNV